MEPDEWGDVLNVNLMGAFHCARAVIPHMRSRTYGRVVNISSVVGQVGNVGQCNYAASKAGLIGFTKSLARESAGKGITVNAIAPGFIKTAMLDTVPGTVREDILKRIPLGRFGVPEDVAEGVAYLVSDAAAYVTGQVLSINGGLSMS
jgi:3-oxoacyl-[acyl-carrier protein] reductase